MEASAKKKTIGKILIAALLLFVAAGAVFAALLLPQERIYRAAAEESEALPYDQAAERLSEAIEQLDGKPFSKDRIDALSALRSERLSKEIDRAIAEDDLDYAAELLKDSSDGRKTEIETELLYRAACATENAGRDNEALTAFRSLGEYRDSAAHAESIEERLAFQAAQAVFTGSNYDEGIAALHTLGTEQALAAADALLAQREERMAQIQQQATDRISAGAWHTAGIGGQNAWIAGDARYGEAPKEARRTVSGLTAVFFLQDGRVIPNTETYGAAETIASFDDITDLSAGLTHGLFLHADGTVTGLGSGAYGRLAVRDWNGIVSVAAGAWHSVGLKADGTVLAAGGNGHGQCDVSDWTDVVSVKAGLWHTVGLKRDGTVEAAGDNTYGQCDVSDWRDVCQIACGACSTVGLKRDGTVVAAGDNACGQCDVSDWTDVAAVAAGAYHTVGVRYDGSLLCAGRLPKELPNEPLFDSNWKVSGLLETEAHGTAKAYIEGEGSELGPWLYLDPSGAVQICIDDSEPQTPFRADMLATANALPNGRVTDPEATGKVIRMPALLPQEQAKNAHAVLAMTGDYLGFTSNRKGVMLRGGVVYYDRTEQTTAAILPNGTMALYPRGKINAEQLRALGVKDSFSFGPVLVEDGKAAYDDGGKKGVVTMRVALGYSDPFHFLAAVTLRDRQNQMSFTDVANVCVRYGCKAAYNLDGGHSTSLVFMGRELSLLTLTGTPHHNIRGLSDVVTFLENDAVQPD